VDQVLASIFRQLSTSSLAELKIDKPDDLSWKHASGFHFQCLAYTLLGAYDIAGSYFVERLADPDPDTASEQAGYISHIIDCHKQLQQMLTSATRTKRLKGANSAVPSAIISLASDVMRCTVLCSAAHFSFL
jgi:hypothetical protein